jgi:sugar phosphate isomerase/epimerase
VYVRDLIRMASDLGAPIVRVFAAWPGITLGDDCGRYDIARRLWAATHEEFGRDRAWDRCRSGLVEAAKWASEYGIVLALQNHPPITDNGNDMLRMIREVDSPSLKACLDAPLAKKQEVTDMRRAVGEVGLLQVLSHFGGEYDQQADGPVEGYVRQSDASLVPEDFYADFVRGMLDINYQGYIGYELCHPLPKVDGRLVGIDFADKNARLAAAYLRAIIAGAQQVAAV